MRDPYGHLRGCLYEWQTIPSMDTARALDDALAPIRTQPPAVDYVRQMSAQAEVLLLPPGAESDVRCSIEAVRAVREGSDDARLRHLFLSSRPPRFEDRSDNLPMCVAEALGHDPALWRDIRWFWEEDVGYGHLTLTAEGLTMSWSMLNAGCSDVSWIRWVSRTMRRAILDFDVLRDGNRRLWGWIEATAWMQEHGGSDQNPRSHSWGLLSEWLQAADDPQGPAGRSLAAMLRRNGA